MSALISEQLLTVDDLTQFLKLNRRTLYRLLENGELPFAIKIGGNWRFRHSDVYEWLESKKDEQMNRKRTHLLPYLSLMLTFFTLKTSFKDDL